MPLFDSTGRLIADDITERFPPEGPHWKTEIYSSEILTHTCDFGEILWVNDSNKENRIPVTGAKLTRRRNEGM